MRKYVLTVENEGLKLSSDVSQSAAKWEAYTKFRETPNLFVLYAGPRLFYSFPKRFFTPEQLAKFRELAGRYVAAK
jgi:hypothetical protein